MTPLLRKRGVHGSEKTITRGREGVQQKMVATNKVSDGRCRTKRSTSTTVRNKRQGIQKKKTTTSDNNAQPQPKMLGGIFGMGFVHRVPGDDSEEYVIPDQKTLMEASLAEVENSKKESEGAFKCLNTFLKSRGMSADKPYKDAIQKLLNGEETIDRKIRERIAKYFQQKLGDIKRFISSLLSLDDWGIEVAGYIVEIINKEVTEHLGVEVTELKEISLKAEGILNESNRGLMLARGEYLKDCVRSWCSNTNWFKIMAREWVEKPTSSFSSCDADGYGPHI